MADRYVLLVEDNLDDVTLTEFAFKKAKVPNKLTVVRDGREALNYLFRLDGYNNRDTDHNPGLVLLDLKLPIVSGLEVLKEIKANKDTSQIPVIVLTSSSEDNDRVESYRLGASNYICKPTGLTEFIEIIEQLKAKWLNSN
jgi:two-component system, response regulator